MTSLGQQTETVSDVTSEQPPKATLDNTSGYQAETTTQVASTKLRETSATTLAQLLEATVETTRQSKILASQTTTEMFAKETSSHSITEPSTDSIGTSKLPGTSSTAEVPMRTDFSKESSESSSLKGLRIVACQI